MRLTVNGIEKEIPLNSNNSLQEFLNILERTGNNFAVAVNLEFVPKVSYSCTFLKEGDHLEILNPTVGG